MPKQLFRGQLFQGGLFRPANLYTGGTIQSVAVNASPVEWMALVASFPATVAPTYAAADQGTGSYVHGTPFLTNPVATVPGDVITLVVGGTPGGLNSVPPNVVTINGVPLTLLRRVVSIGDPDLIDLELPWIDLWYLVNAGLTGSYAISVGTSGVTPPTPEVIAYSVQVSKSLTGSVADSDGDAQNYQTWDGNPAVGPVRYSASCNLLLAAFWMRNDGDDGPFGPLPDGFTGWVSPFVDTGQDEQATNAASETFRLVTGVLIIGAAASRLAYFESVQTWQPWLSIVQPEL